MPVRAIPQDFEIIQIPNGSSGSFEINRNTIYFEIYEPTGSHTVHWDINRLPSSDHPYHTVKPQQKGGLSQMANYETATIYVTSDVSQDIWIEVRKLLGGSH